MTAAGVLFGAGVVQRLLPIRPPFLMVDAVLSYVRTPAPRLRARRFVSANDPVMAAHFPMLPIVPGTQVLEGLTQSCALLAVIEHLYERVAAAGVADDVVATLSVLERGFRLQAGFEASVPLPLMAELSRGQGNWMGMLAGVHAKFVAPVFPSCAIDYDVCAVRRMEEMWHLEVVASADGRDVVTGTFTHAFRQLALPPQA